MGKQNVRVSGLGSWNDYLDAEPASAVARIYAAVDEHSRVARDWYWNAIAIKRQASRGARLLSFLLVAAGASLPLLAGLKDDTTARLIFTQLGVMALAIAGLAQAADSVFGWSRGWMRYIATVTAMERATRAFSMDWAAFFLEHGSPTAEHVPPLFRMARSFDDTISRLQADETNQWIVDFNTGAAVLSELLNSEREVSDKARVAAVKATKPPPAAE